MPSTTEDGKLREEGQEEGSTDNDTAIMCHHSESPHTHTQHIHIHAYDLPFKRSLQLVKRMFSSPASVETNESFSVATAMLVTHCSTKCVAPHFLQCCQACTVRYQVRYCWLVLYFTYNFEIVTPKISDQ